MATIVAYDKEGNQYEADESKFINTRRVYGIYISDGRVLLVKEKNLNFWEIPGGGIDHAESDSEALVREMKEETGLDIDKNISLMESYTENYVTGEKEFWISNRNFYLVTVLGGQIIEENNDPDVASAKFFSIDEMTHLNMKPREREVIMKVLSSIAPSDGVGAIKL